MAPGKVPDLGALRETAQRRSVCLPADQEARRVVASPFLQAAFPGRCFSRCVRAVLNSSPFMPSRRSQHRKVYAGLSVTGRVGLALATVRAWWLIARHSWM